MGPRPPWVLQIAPLSGTPGRSSGAVSYANQEETLPFLDSASCAITATFAGRWEIPAGWCLTGSKGGLALPGGCQLPTS
eukprot:322542-Pyramimonas_sp.AAC.1